MARINARVDAKWRPGQANRVTLILGGFYDAVYDLRPDAYSEDVKDHLRSDGEVRELYWDTYRGPWALRLGKQQVTWGEGDYFRVLDVINPLDMRDFILTYISRFEDARRPLWMVNATYQGDSTETQLLLIPQFRHTLLAPAGADFGPPPGALNGLTWLGESDPKAGLSDPAAGVRVTGSTDEGFDWGGYAYYGYNPNPFLVVDPVAMTAQFVHRRRRLAGASLSVPISQFVLRGDLAYYWDEAYAAANPATGVVPTSDTWAALVGLDYIEDHWTVNAQYSVRRLTQDIALAGTRTKQDMSLYVQWHTLDNRRQVGVLLLQRRDAVNSGMAELRAAIKPASSWKLSLGYDLFYGNRAGLYGQYRDQDRWFTEIEYTF